MPIHSNQAAARLGSLGLVIFAYFVIYPQDLAALLSPVEKTSYAIAPGLYALIGVVIVCWTLMRIWGRRADSQPPS